MTTSLEIITGILMDDSHSLSVGELSRLCAAEASLLSELVEEGVLSPSGARPDDWLFPGSEVVRARRAVRLMRDLELSVPSTALVLSLIEEMDRLRARTRCLEFQLERRQLR